MGDSDAVDLPLHSDRFDEDLEQTYACPGSIKSERIPSLDHVVELPEYVDFYEMD